MSPNKETSHEHDFVALINNSSSSISSISFSISLFTFFPFPFFRTFVCRPDFNPITRDPRPPSLSTWIRIFSVFSAPTSRSQKHKTHLMAMGLHLHSSTSFFFLPGPGQREETRCLEWLLCVSVIADARAFISGGGEMMAEGQVLLLSLPHGLVRS